MKDNEKAALAEACYLLGRLHAHSWNEPAASRAREHQAAIAVLETIRSEIELTLSSIKPQGLVWVLNTDIAGHLDSVSHALKAALPVLKESRPAEEEGPGQPAKRLRDRLIVETLATICPQFDLSQEAGRSIIAEALRLNGIDLSEDGIRIVCERFRKRAKKPPQYYDY
jgi:hypothetical protein